MAKIEIRPLQVTDEVEWRRLWTLYLEYYESSVAEEIYATTFSRLLSDQNNEFSAFIALLDGKPVGLVHFLYHRHCWKVENVCYLQDLYVDASERGTGLGRALIEAVYQAADEAGCPGVYWLTQEFNATGRRLYDRLANLTPFIMYRR